MKVKRNALIIIGHFKPEWQKVPDEERAGFAARVRRAAKNCGVTPLVAYTLTTQGSFLEIWEADDKAKLEEFRAKLESLGYKKYYDQVLMQGERQADWIDKQVETANQARG